MGSISLREVILVAIYPYLAVGSLVEYCQDEAPKYNTHPAKLLKICKAI